MRASVESHLGGLWSTHHPLSASGSLTLLRRQGLGKGFAWIAGNRLLTRWKLGETSRFQDASNPEGSGDQTQSL